VVESVIGVVIGIVGGQAGVGEICGHDDRGISIDDYAVASPRSDAISGRTVAASMIAPEPMAVPGSVTAPATRTNEGSSDTAGAAVPLCRTRRHRRIGPGVM
jgi:hypothetical protein